MSDDPEAIPIPEFLRRQVDDGGLRASHRTIERLQRERDEAHGYLAGLMDSLAPPETTDRLPSLLGITTQIDNLFVYWRDRAEKAEARVERLQAAIENAVTDPDYTNPEEIVRKLRAALAEEDDAGSDDRSA